MIANRIAIFLSLSAILAFFTKLLKISKTNKSINNNTELKTIQLKINVLKKKIGKCYTEYFKAAKRYYDLAMKIEKYKEDELFKKNNPKKIIEYKKLLKEYETFQKDVEESGKTLANSLTELDSYSKKLKEIANKHDDTVADEINELNKSLNKLSDDINKAIKMINGNKDMKNFFESSYDDEVLYDYNELRLNIYESAMRGDISELEKELFLYLV